jgi:putative SOS response-associated peptidase YedK
MCGRFTRSRQVMEYVAAFQLNDAPDLSPSYNVAPTQPVLAARLQDGRRAGVLLRWGLIPFWSKDGKPFINARSETVNEKSTFRAAFRKRRCLILADGRFEWQAQAGRKQPFYFRPRDGKPVAFAGLWDCWQGEAAVETCAILTTEANTLAKPVHDRMPVILPPDTYGAWLDPAADPAELATLLRPFPAEALECYPVGMLVNSPRNNRSECIEPAA